MKHLRRNLRAISPVLAVLMMIAVAIAGSLVVYAWVMGYIDLSTDKSGQSIIVQSMANDATDTDLLIYVQNNGEGTVQLDENGCLYVNGELVACDITGVTVSDHVATLSAGQTATLTVAEGAALPGVRIDVRITTLLGTPAEKTGYPAGKARAAPVLDHFEFASIDSPQISDIAFSITITAMDQYGDKYTDYTSTNTLEYSGGDITPAVTGGFVAGEWTGNVTVTGAFDDAVISTAYLSDETKVGISGPFDVDAAVTFVSAGTGGLYIPGASPSVDTTPTYPSGLQDGDLILLQIGIRDDTSVPDTPSGFNLLYGPESAGESTTKYGRQWIFYKFSDGTEAGAFTITWGTATPTNVISQMFAFRYVKVGTPTIFAEAKTVGTQESDVVYAEDVTTAGARRLAVCFVYAVDNPTIGDFNGESGGDWALPSGDSYTMGEGTGTHEDSYIVLQAATMLEAGTISGGSYSRVGVHTDAGANSWVIIAFALIPVD